MLIQRVITLNLSQEFIDLTVENQNQVQKCVGWLTFWACQNPKFKNLVIYGDKSGNLNSTFRDEDGNITYSMYSERREDGSYSTHS